MSDCNQMNCRGSYGAGRRMPAMSQGRRMDNSMRMRGSASYARTTGAVCTRSAGEDGGSRNAVSLSDLPLAMGYVPWQVWQDIYEPEKALARGTIFAQLDKPFCGVRGGRRA